MALLERRLHRMPLAVGKSLDRGHLAPSAWTASTLQALTLRPSSSTVHDPQFEVSQPIGVPTWPATFAEPVDEKSPRLDLITRDDPIDGDADVNHGSSTDGLPEPASIGPYGRTAVARYRSGNAAWEGTRVDDKSGTPTSAGLILAAGAGRRFGGPKAPAVVEGERLVDRAVRVLAEAGCRPIVVVLGAWVGDVPDAKVVVNERWEEGMATSLQAGLAAIEHSDAERVILSLVDLVGLTSSAVRRVLACDAELAAATYDGVRGHPAGQDALGGSRGAGTGGSWGQGLPHAEPRPAGADRGRRSGWRRRPGRAAVAWLP